MVFDNIIPSLILDRVCTSQDKEYFYCVSKVKKLASKVAISVSCTKPSSSWHKLNIDGAHPLVTQVSLVVEVLLGIVRGIGLKVFQDLLGLRLV